MRPRPLPLAMQPPAIGQVLAGRYRLERELGRGGMASVFEATDLRHQRRVAVKLMDPELAAAIGAERFLREIRIVASLAHPHVLPLHDSGADGPQLFYVMPLVEGETLRARLQRDGVLPVAEAVRLGAEIADALAYAHARGVVHRDVKPENILLHGSGETGQALHRWHALVADFGIARAMEETRDGSLTATGISVGTPAYMSPEQALGQRADARSDVFSLGSLLYEMLTGAPAFGAESGPQTIARVITAAVPPASTRRREVPPALDRIIAGALAKEPSERTPDAGVLGAQLRALLEGRSPVGLSRRHAARFWRTGRGRLVGAGALLVLASAAAWAVARRAAPRSVPASASGVSVAVLPFTDATGDSTRKYLGEAIADELVAALGQVPGLLVASRTSTTAAMRANSDVRVIARRLGVTTVLEGTIQHAGAGLRLRVNLVSATDGAVTWSDSLQRPMADLFTLQDELAQVIARRLQPRLSGGATRATSGRAPDPESHDLLLQARYAMVAGGRGGLAEAVGLVERAIARDSNYAAAWAQLSQIQHRLALFEDSTSASLFRARSAAERAVALDSLSPEANAALGMARFRYDWRWEEAERYLRRAIDLNPSLASAHQEYARFLRSMGRFPEARLEQQRAGEIDPLGGAAQPLATGRLAFFARDFDGAIRETRAHPDTTGGMWIEWLAMAHIARGDYAAAESLLQRPAASLAPGAPFDLALVYARTGRAAGARRLLDSLRTRSPVWASQSAWVWAALGEVDSALGYLNRAVATRDALVVDLKVHPFLDPLRPDPRFRRLLEALRFPP